jgi:ribosomal protein S12 methylthiotransferase accessory factor
MEALERAVAETPPVETVRHCRDELLAMGLAFDAIEEFRAIGASLSASVAIDWVRGVDLVKRNAVLVPLDAVTLDRTKPHRYWQSSDGLASGNTLDEAVLHGLLERIERDADVLFRLAKRPARERACFDPRRLDNPVVDGLLAMTTAAGFGVVTLDMTSDLGVPAVLAYLYPSGGDMPGLRYIDVTLGSGAHFNVAKATVRALTEAVQSRLTLISGARDDVDPQLFSVPLHPMIASDLRLTPCSRPPGDVEDVGSTIAERISALLVILGTRRINRILAIDLAPEETRFSVVKLLVPELESPDGNRAHRFGPRAVSKLTVF